MKLIIAGSRTITSMPHLEEGLRHMASRFPALVPSEVVCGMARGADSLGRMWAEARGIPVSLWPADWNANGRRAGFMRNTQMAQYADILLALWDGQSKGTGHMISEMARLGKPTFVWFSGAGVDGGR
jgi:hypothetical protein